MIGLLMHDAASFHERIGVPDTDIKRLSVLIAIRLEQGRPRELVDMLRAVPGWAAGQRRGLAELEVMALLDANEWEQAAELASGDSSAAAHAHAAARSVAAGLANQLLRDQIDARAVERF